MAVIGRSGLLVVCLAALSTLFIQNMHRDSMLEGVPSAKDAGARPELRDQ